MDRYEKLLKMVKKPKVRPAPQLSQIGIHEPNIKGDKDLILLSVNLDIGSRSKASASEFTAQVSSYLSRISEDINLHTKYYMTVILLPVTNQFTNVNCIFPVTPSGEAVNQISVIENGISTLENGINEISENKLSL